MADGPAIIRIRIDPPHTRQLTIGDICGKTPTSPTCAIFKPVTRRKLGTKRLVFNPNLHQHFPSKTPISLILLCISSRPDCLQEPQSGYRNIGVNVGAVTRRNPPLLGRLGFSRALLNDRAALAATDRPDLGESSDRFPKPVLVRHDENGYKPAAPSVEAMWAVIVRP